MYTETQNQAQHSADGPHRKFMFERSFDPGAAVRVERKPVTLKPEQYDALKKESYEQGFAAGRGASIDEHEAKLAALLAQAGQKIDHLVAGMDAMRQQSEDGMRRMALAIAKKFLPAFVAKNGMQEIEAILAEAMGEMVHEPRLVVRVNESQFDVLNARITELAAQKAYAGKVVVLADAAVGAGDCRIEWADGGMERHTAALWDKIEKTVAP